jgi:thiol-disulfide isomerase/thioredoxin
LFRCGHCKKLAPEYERLGASFKKAKSVLIAKVYLSYTLRIKLVLSLMNLSAFLRYSLSFYATMADKKITGTWLMTFPSALFVV